MNKLISLAILVGVIVLVIYGVFVSASRRSNVYAGADGVSVPDRNFGQSVSRSSEEPIVRVPDGIHKNETPDLTLRGFLGAPTITIETRESLLTRIELIPMDSRGHPIVFSPEVAGLPQRASFDPKTNILVWRPWYSDAGTYELVFQDTGSQYTQKIIIHVEDVPLQGWYQDWIQSEAVQSAMVK